MLALQAAGVACKQLCRWSTRAATSLWPYHQELGNQIHRNRLGGVRVAGILLLFAPSLPSSMIG